MITSVKRKAGHHRRHYPRPHPGRRGRSGRGRRLRRSSRRRRAIRCARPPASQPAADLLRRPPLAWLRGDDGGQLRVGAKSVRFRAATIQMRLPVREPRLIAPIWLPIASDLPIHTLIALTDPSRDRLHPLAGIETIGDLDPVILGQIPATDRRVDELHTASVDEPHRSAAERHSDLGRRGRAARAPPDQLEVSAFDLTWHLVRRITRIATPPDQDSQRSLETAPGPGAGSATPPSPQAPCR